MVYLLYLAMIQIFVTIVYFLYLAMIMILVTVCLPAVYYNDTDFHDRLPAVSCYNIDFGDSLFTCCILL